MITNVAGPAGFAIPAGAQGITALSAGNMFAWFIAQVLKFKFIGVIILAAVIVGVLFFINKVAYKLYDWIPGPVAKKETAE
jgi:galactitol-specific phosphotransferase system IIC component